MFLSRRLCFACVYQVYIYSYLIKFSNAQYQIFKISAQKPHELQTRSAKDAKDAPGRVYLVIKSSYTTVLNIVEGRRQGGRTLDLAARVFAINQDEGNSRQ